MTSLFSAAPAPGTHLPIFTVQPYSAGACPTGAEVLVGDLWQGASLDDELEQHIEDCRLQWLFAYDRFQLYGLPADREEALLHLHRMNEAILARSPEVLARRHAEFEQRLSEGVDYFQSGYAAALADQVRVG